MAQNRGKQFEEVVREAFEKLPYVSIDRLHDQTNGFRGSQNICDFIVYREPYEYYIECKSVHGNTLSIHSNDKTGRGEVYGNITKRQWEGLSKKARIHGVFAGVICWWIDKDITRYIPIEVLNYLKCDGYKSVRYDYESICIVDIHGKKKRVFFDYDMEVFLNEVSNRKKRKS